MANIGDILNSPEQGWRRVLFSDFDSINFYMYKNYTENYKDLIIYGGLRLYYEDVTATYFSFSNSPYTTKWRLIGSTIKEEVNLFNLPPDSAYQVNYITPDSEHRLLMEGVFAPEDDTLYSLDPYNKPEFHAEINYSDTDFFLYAIDFYDGLSTPKVVKGTPNEGINGTLANGLVAHYSFNDGSLADLSGNGFDLVQVGDVYNTTDKDGQIGQAKEVTDVSGNYLKCEIKNLINGTNNALSVWVYIPDLAHAGTFLSIGHEVYSYDSILFFRQWYDRLMISCNYIGTDNKTTVGWHNIIYNGRKLYIDKVLVDYRLSPLTMDGFLYLFAGYPKGLVCKLDEIRLYNRLLTGDATTVGQIATGEIAEIFDMGVNYQGDIEPPTFNTVNTSNITSSSIDLNINCNENATAYYKLYDRGATAPTNTELQATHDGTMTLTANNLVTENITGLTALKDYDLYVVAEDTSWNLQSLPSKIQFKTITNVKSKISEIIFNIDFDKTQLGKFIEIKYLDIKADGTSILYKNPIVKYWTNYDKTVKVFDTEGKLFENSTDLYFQIEGEGYETSDIIHKELKIMNIDGFQGGYNGGVVGYANHTNDNYKTSEARILIPLTNTSFISYKK